MIKKNAIESMEEMMNEYKKRPILDRVIEDYYNSYKNRKSSLKWIKKTIKSLLSLKKEKIIYIYDHHEIESSCSYLDINIATRRGLFRQLDSYWIVTLLDRDCFNVDQNMILKLGGEYYPSISSIKDEDLFENFYIDRGPFLNEQEIIESFKLWASKFFPWMLEKEIRFEYKEAFLLRKVFNNLLFKWRINR